MKTMKKVVGLKSISTMMIAFVLIFASCKKDEAVLSSTDNQNVSSESVSDSYSDEAADVSNIAIGGLSNSQYDGGRVDADTVKTLKDLDDRLKCAVVTLTRSPNSTKERPIGSIVINFGTGCTDNRNVTRKGKIMINYDGVRFFPGSTIITTFDGYFRNGVKVEGVHTLTNVQASALSYFRFTAKIADGKLTFEDGKTITRVQNITREWQRGANPLLDKWIVLKDSKANGTNKNGKAYTMTVTTDLVYSRACAISNKVFIPVSGIKEFIVDGKTYKVDFGTGDCDNEVTVSVGNASKTITVGADGN
ncbi:MAG: hypothetical protein ACKVOQ_14835 [Cyclobacteriaceae bacterium]